MLKVFLSTLKGKIIAGISGGAVLIAGIVGALMITSGPEDYRTIKIQELNGSTTIASNDVSVQEAYKGMNLESGDVVTVQKDGNMTLLLDMDKYMFADEGTKFKVEASGNSDKGNTKTRIVLEEGSVLCRLDTKLGDEETFEVETPNSVMSVRGTIFKMTIYKDENGENYARVDVLEGAVKVDLYNENGEKTGEEGLIEAGKAATVHSNPDISEFVIGDSDISYDDFSEEMATFVVNVVDDGREICIGSDLFKHYTGLENHPETKTVVKEATCSEEGAQDVYCDTCKMIVRTEPIEKLEHTPGEWQVDEDAPCVERIRCTVCDEILEEKEADFNKHDLERKTNETANGCNFHIVVQDVCKNCNMTREISVRDEVRHTYGDWQVVKNASCTDAGERQMVCSVCNDTISESIAATGHSYGGYNTVKAATCIAAGSKERICSNCDNTETESIEATGHSYGSYSTVQESTCTSAGSKEKICSSCGDKQTETIAATGHSYGGYNTVKAATCIAEGSKERICSNCDNTETESIEATGHSYGSYSTVQESTCTSAGSKEKICSSCGDKQTETIAATGHKYGEWITTLVASCEEVGNESRTCSVCGNQETREIEALGHDVYHDPSKMHVVENYSGGVEVGGKVEIFAYMECSRCGTEVIPHMTGTVTQNHDSSGATPNFTCDICGTRG